MIVKTIKINGIIKDNVKKINKALKSEIIFFQPTTSNDRLANQYGYFSIHNNPKNEFNSKSKYGELEKIIIPKKLKKDYYCLLQKYK